MSFRELNETTEFVGLFENLAELLVKQVFKCFQNLIMIEVKFVSYNRQI